MRTRLLRIAAALLAVAGLVVAAPSDWWKAHADPTPHTGTGAPRVAAATLIRSTARFETDCYPNPSGGDSVSVTEEVYTYDDNSRVVRARGWYSPQAGGVYGVSSLRWFVSLLPNSGYTLIGVRTNPDPWTYYDDTWTPTDPYPSQLHYWLARSIDPYGNSCDLKLEG